MNGQCAGGRSDDSGPTRTIEAGVMFNSWILVADALTSLCLDATLLHCLYVCMCLVTALLQNELKAWSSSMCTMMKMSTTCSQIPTTMLTATMRRKRNSRRARCAVKCEYLCPCYTALLHWHVYPGA